MDPTQPSSPSEASIPPQTTPPIPTPVRYRTRPYHVHMAFLPLVFLIGLGVGFLLFDRSTPGKAPAAQPTTAGQQAAKRYSIPVSDSDPQLGPKDARVTLIMFSDYQCPYCRKWYADTFKTLINDYQGKVRFVYKDFPLTSIHDNAESAAEAARCAGEQGKYWDYQDLLFTGADGLGDAAYQKYAQSLSLDSAKFGDCVASRRYKDAVNADYEFAANLGIQSTPTFFINGLAVVGAEPIDVFKQAIDGELAGSTN